MSLNIQKSLVDQVGYKLYHYGLIKILVTKDLRQRGNNWDDYLTLHKFRHFKQNINPQERVIGGHAIKTKVQGQNLLTVGRLM